MTPALQSEIEKLTHPETGLPGWCPTHKAMWLAEHIIKERLLWIAEIGVLSGRSLIPMALTVRSLGLGGFVLGIDPYQHARQVEGIANEGQIEWSKAIDWNQQFIDTTNRITEMGLTDWCGVLRAPSSSCFGLIGSLDLLHIDGCHSALATHRDIETWVPKVRTGGLVVVDDINWSTISPTLKLLPEWCEEKGYESHTPESSWGVWRRR